MSKFLVAILTHNRSEMVNDAIRSVFEQTYSNWELLVSDNGSHPPACEAIRPEYQRDPRLRLIRHDTLMRGTEHFERIIRYALDRYDYDYLLVLGDDDVLLPSALACVACYSQGYDAILSSFWYYDVPKQTLALYNHDGTNSGTPVSFQALDFFGYFMEYNGVRLVDPALRHRRRPPIGSTHNSTHFFRKSLIQEALQHYGRITVEPFGDIGLFRLGLQAGTNLYINRPLAIIRIHQSYGMAASAGGTASRFLLKAHHDVDFKYSPVKAITFSNGTLESCLALINGLGWAYDRRIHAIFFVRHLREILRDRPWTATTVRDTLETLPFLLSRAPQLVSLVALYIRKHFRRPINSPTLVHNVDTIWDAVPICEAYAAHQ